MYNPGNTARTHFFVFLILLSKCYQIDVKIKVDAPARATIHPSDQLPDSDWSRAMKALDEKALSSTHYSKKVEQKGPKHIGDVRSEICDNIGMLEVSTLPHN